MGSPAVTGSCYHDDVCEDYIMNNCLPSNILTAFARSATADKLKAELAEKEVQRKYSADAAKRKVTTFAEF